MYRLLSKGVILPKEELNQLVATYQNTKDNELLNRIILSQVKWVWDIVIKRHSGFPQYWDDLFSEGIIGLIKAANTYDINSGNLFTTYSTTCITNQMLMFLRKVKKHENRDTISLNIILNSDYEGNQLLVEDIIGYDHLELDFWDKEEMREVLSVFEEALEKISFRGNIKKYFKDMLFDYYFNKMNQNDLAEKYNIAQSYVSRVIRKFENFMIKIMNRRMAI